MVRRVMINFIFLLARSFAQADPGVIFAHPGYLESVEEERDSYVVEMNAAPIKPPSQSTNWQDEVFSTKLSEEFRERYRQKFGRTEAEQIWREPSPYNFYNHSGLSGEFRGDELAYAAEKNKFGQYMTKRLLEFHVDNYARSKPTIRKVYELKEKYSNLDVNLVSSVRLFVNYALTSNTLKLRLDNPWLENDVFVSMNQSGFGPSEPKEVSLSLGKWLGKKDKLESFYRAYEKSWTVVARHHWTPQLNTSFTTHFDALVDDVRQDTYIAGLGWVY